MWLAWTRAELTSCLAWSRALPTSNTCRRFFGTLFLINVPYTPPHHTRGRQGPPRALRLPCLARHVHPRHPPPAGGSHGTVLRSPRHSYGRVLSSPPRRTIFFSAAFLSGLPVVARMGTC
eukprot:7587764-Pyramimonas_sp.AAC.2